MSQPADERPPEPVAFHTSPLDAAGFTMIPNTVLWRQDLSIGAKLVYGYLKYLAWRGRTTEVGAARDVIAADLRVGVKTVTGYIKELREAPAAEGADDPECPMLIVSIRRGLGRPNVYAVNPPETGHSGKVISTSLDGSDRPVPARARSSSKPSNTKNEEEPPLPPLDVPPPIVLIDGRNVPLDTLAALTGVEADSPRYPQAIVALNGRLHKTTGAVLEKGIRHLYWGECHRHALAAVTPDEVLRLRELQGNPERFAVLLADRIRKKADTYRAAMPGAALTPKALRDWWLDIEHQDRAGDADLENLPDV